jgi:hypothetical protein
MSDNSYLCNKLGNVNFSILGMGCRIGETKIFLNYSIIIKKNEVVHNHVYSMWYKKGLTIKKNQSLIIEKLNWLD